MSLQELNVIGLLYISKMILYTYLPYLSSLLDDVLGCRGLGVGLDSDAFLPEIEVAEDRML